MASYYGYEIWRHKSQVKLYHDRGMNLRVRPRVKTKSWRNWWIECISEGGMPKLTIRITGFHECWVGITGPSQLWMWRVAYKKTSTQGMCIASGAHDSSRKNNLILFCSERYINCSFFFNFSLKARPNLLKRYVQIHVISLYLFNIHIL